MENKDSKTVFLSNRMDIIESKEPRAMTLPPFIGNFNGIYGFIRNIKSLLGLVFGTPSGGVGEETLQEVLHNQQMLTEIQSDLEVINQQLDDIITKEDLTQQLMNQLLDISKEQSEMLEDISWQLTHVTDILMDYLPTMTKMLNEILIHSEITNEQLAYLNQQLEEISQEIEIIYANVLTNATITEITPSFQRIQYVNGKFTELIVAYLTTEKEEKLQLATNSSDTAAFDNKDLIEFQNLVDLSLDVTKNDMDSFEFSLNTLHNVMIGNNLYGRSAINTTGKLYTEDSIGGIGSPMGKTYNFLAVVTSYLAKGYVVLSAARKILGLADIDYSPTLDQRVQKEKDVFKEELPNLDTTFSNTSYWNTTSGNTNDASVVIEADPGYALIALELNGSYIIGYQAKLKGQFEVDYDTLSKKVSTGPSVANVFCLTGNKPVYHVQHITFEGVYVITKIKFDRYNNGNDLRYEVSADYYDTGTETIKDWDRLTKSSEGGDLIEFDEPVKNANIPYSFVADVFYAPLHSFGLNVDKISKKIDIRCDSYLKKYLLASDFSNKDANLIFTGTLLPEGYVPNNLIGNGNIQNKYLYPWVKDEKTGIAEVQVKDGNNQLYTQGGRFSQQVREVLKPNTKYKIGYSVARDSLVYIQDTDGYILYDGKHRSDVLESVNSEFTTGNDELPATIIFTNQANANAYGDNFSLIESGQVPAEGLVRNGTFTEGLAYWMVEEGDSTGSISIVDYHNSKALSCKNTGTASQRIKLKSNTTYEISYDIVDAVRVYVQYNNIAYYDENLYSPGEMTRIYHTFTTDDNKTGAELVLGVNEHAEMSEPSGIIDNVSIVAFKENLVKNGNFDQGSDKLEYWIKDYADSTNNVRIDPYMTGFETDNILELRYEGNVTQTLDGKLEPNTTYQIMYDIQYSARITIANNVEVLYQQEDYIEYPNVETISSTFQTNSNVEGLYIKIEAWEGNTGQRALIDNVKIIDAI